MEDGAGISSLVNSRLFEPAPDRSEPVPAVSHYVCGHETKQKQDQLPCAGSMLEQLCAVADPAEAAKSDVYAVGCIC